MTIPPPTNPTNPPAASEYEGINPSSGQRTLKWATPAEALAGVVSDKLMSPATAKFVIDALLVPGGGEPPQNCGVAIGYSDKFRPRAYPEAITASFSSLTKLS